MIHKLNISILNTSIDRCYVKNEPVSPVVPAQSALKNLAVQCYSRVASGSLVILFLITTLLSGCGGKATESPLNTIKKSLKDEPTYSVLLEDMNQEGTFLKDYFHKYLIVLPDKSIKTDWFKVDENYFSQNQEFLGMTLLTKKEGEYDTSPAPPGYGFVGDSRYGNWKQDSHGGSFWEFYGKYALISSLFGGWYRPVYRNDYSGYQSHRASHRPFFGRNKEFGSTGKITRQKKPDFYSRCMASKTSSFSKKVGSRIGRSKTGFRSRSGGVGK